MLFESYNFSFQAMPIVRLVDEIIDRADKCRASDIHVDPRNEDVRIRFRIDGMLHDVCSMPKEIYNEFITRIKIISGLRIDERIVPQDGRFTVGNTLDIRVTVVSSYYGESIVMRLLRRTENIQTLSELGFLSGDEEKINALLKIRQGLILVTGPTGSGKTTTLYSLLAMISSSSVSTITIEDPVEYAIAHARQIQVQQKRGINFANGLRSILRQDPDVIMVGEIRDYETAALATSAALTGHLVLSTLHTNDAFSTITRFMEMGIEPYLVAATVRLVISQRLVRRLCMNCRKEVVLKDEEREMMGNYTNIANAYAGQGCESCYGTGYCGRTVVSEILPIDRTLSKSINERKMIEPGSAGMKSIIQCAIEKYQKGITSFNEIIKILHE